MNPWAIPGLLAMVATFGLVLVAFVAAWRDSG